MQRHDLRPDRSPRCRFSGERHAGTLKRVTPQHFANRIGLIGAAQQEADDSVLGYLLEADHRHVAVRVRSPVRRCPLVQHDARQIPHTLGKARLSELLSERVSLGP